MIVPMNFTKETQYMSTFKQKKKGGNTLKDALSGDDMILENVTLELEPRDSDFIRLDSKGYLYTAFIKVWLDKSSIVDCLMAKNITQDADVVFENVSNDRRSLKYKRTMKLKEFDFDSPVILRLFSIDDVVQIKFDDEISESFVSL